MSFDGSGSACTASFHSAASTDLFADNSGHDKIATASKIDYKETSREVILHISDEESYNSGSKVHDLETKLKPGPKSIDSVTFQPISSQVEYSFDKMDCESDLSFTGRKVNPNLHTSAILTGSNNEIICINDSDESSCSVITSSDEDINTNHQYTNTMNSNILMSGKKQIVQNWLRNFSLNSTSKPKCDSEKNKQIESEVWHLNEMISKDLKSMNEVKDNSICNMSVDSYPISLKNFPNENAKDSGEVEKMETKELSFNKNLLNIEHQSVPSPKCEKRYNLRRQKKGGKENIKPIYESDESFENGKPKITMKTGKRKIVDTSFTSTRSNLRISFRHKRKPIRKLQSNGGEDDIMSSIIDSVMSTKISSDEEILPPPSYLNEDNANQSVNLVTPRRKLFFRKAFDNSLDDDVEDLIDIQPISNNAITSTPLTKSCRLKGLSAFLSENLQDAKQDNKNTSNEGENKFIRPDKQNTDRSLRDSNSSGEEIKGKTEKLEEQPDNFKDSNKQSSVDTMNNSCTKNDKSDDDFSKIVLDETNPSKLFLQRDIKNTKKAPPENNMLKSIHESTVCELLEFVEDGGKENKISINSTNSNSNKRYSTKSLSCRESNNSDFLDCLSEDSFTMIRKPRKRMKKINLSQSEEEEERDNVPCGSADDKSPNEDVLKRSSNSSIHEVKSDYITRTEIDNKTEDKLSSSNNISKGKHSSSYHLCPSNSMDSKTSLMNISGCQHLVDNASSNNFKSSLHTDNEQSFAGIDTILSSSNSDSKVENGDPEKMNIKKNITNTDLSILKHSRLSKEKSVHSFQDTAPKPAESSIMDLSGVHGEFLNTDKAINNLNNTSPIGATPCFDNLEHKTEQFEKVVDKDHSGKVQSDSLPTNIEDKDPNSLVKSENISDTSMQQDVSIVVISDGEDSFTRICRSKTPKKKNKLNDSTDSIIDVDDWVNSRTNNIPKRNNKKRSDDKYDPDILIVKSIDSSCSEASDADCVVGDSFSDTTPEEESNDKEEPWVDLATYLRKNVPAMSIPLDNSTALKKKKALSEIVLPGHSSCLEHTSFLLSLTEEVPLEMCHPEAIKYRESFDTYKNTLIDILFKLYNEKIFRNKLPLIEIKWSGKLTTTSGLTKSSSKITKTGKHRSSSIILSKTVVNSASVLRDVLIHELCHAANWLIDMQSGGHGPLFKKWVDRVWAVFPEIPKVKTYHQYELKWKYIYRCSFCGHERGKMKLSLENNICGLCGGAVTVFS